MLDYTLGFIAFEVAGLLQNVFWNISDMDCDSLLGTENSGKG